MENGISLMVMSPERVVESVLRNLSGCLAGKASSQCCGIMLRWCLYWMPVISSMKRLTGK